MKSLKTTARWTGLGYLIIFISGFFANFYTLKGMMADGNAQLTVQNIASQSKLFQLGVASFCIMIFVDILLEMLVIGGGLIGELSLILWLLIKG